jgi:hypothetical protein
MLPDPTIHIKSINNPHLPILRPDKRVRANVNVLKNERLTAVFMEQQGSITFFVFKSSEAGLHLSFTGTDKWYRIFSIMYCCVVGGMSIPLAGSERYLIKAVSETCAVNKTGSPL